MWADRVWDCCCVLLYSLGADMGESHVGMLIDDVYDCFGRFSIELLAYQYAHKFSELVPLCTDTTSKNCHVQRQRQSTKGILN